MGLKDLRKRLATSTSEIQNESLQDRYLGRAGVCIADAPLRVPVVLCGEVTRQKLVPRAGSPVLELTVADGSGEIYVIFTGRRHIQGLSHGRGVVLEGVAHHERGRLVILNPAYTLLE
jgi:hypothetical protein